MVSNTLATTALKPLTGAAFRQYTVCMYSINKSVKKHMPPLRSARILDQLCERIRYLHYSLRTEEVYVYRAKAFIRVHDFRHLAEMGKAEIEAYLMWLEINESDPMIGDADAPGEKLESNLRTEVTLTE